MAFLVHIVRMVPAALRVTLAGGAAYGSLRAGVWKDSSESREQLDSVQDSLHRLREIEYTQTPAPSSPAAQVQAGHWLTAMN